MEEKSKVKIILKTAGGLAIVIGSFYTTLKVMDYFSTAPMQSGRLNSIKIEEATYGANCPSALNCCDELPKISERADGRTTVILMSVSRAAAEAGLEAIAAVN
jgi:hypothetical protein